MFLARSKNSDRQKNITLGNLLIINIMITLPAPQPSNCYECPMARHLHSNHFACGNSLTTVVKGHFESTPECHEAVIEASRLFDNDRPGKFVKAGTLPDFKELDLEWIAERIKLSLNWLDVYPDWVVPDGDNLVEVILGKFRIGYIKRQNHLYYSDRLFGVRSLNPHEIALHMVNLQYLDGVVDEIIIDRALAPEYI
jgi:hypothetical protein